MIEIRMDTKRLKLSVKGHATPEESEKYKEICAAASALAQSLMYSISKYDDIAKITDSIQYRGDPGDLFLLVMIDRSKTWDLERLHYEQAIMDKFMVYADGMELLAKSHPYSVTMIRDGKRIKPEEDE